MNLPAPAPRPASVDAVLGYAWDAAEFTATDALAATGLTRATTIEAMNALVERGLLRELANAREAGAYQKGRPARRFELREDAALLVGVDAGRSHITALVTDLRGTEKARHELHLDDDAVDVRRTALTASVDHALSNAGATRDRVLALCVGVAAPVDAAGRSPRHPVGFWERMNPELGDVFSWVPVLRIENDASLAAIAEGARGAAQDCANYVSLLAGSRLGAGVVVDGRLLRGRHGGVGEMVAFDHVVGVESADGLGVRAAEWAADHVATGRATGALSQVPTAELDGRRVLALAASGDQDAAAIASRVSVVLARIVSVLGSMFDPEKVIVSGAISAGVDDVVAAARSALPTGLDLPAPELVVSQLGGDVVVVGAVAAARAAARERVLDLG